MGFYQKREFIAGNNINIIQNKLKNSIYIYMFLCAVLNIEKYRYSYGRARTKRRIITEKIKLPIDKNGEPDWQFMEDYIKSLPYSANL